MKTHSTIIRTLITEKSSNIQAGGSYTFEIAKDATKIDVKNAVRDLYGVEVDKVTVMRVPKKTRTVGRGREWTKRPVYKKAIVRLKGKKTIDPNKIKEIKKKK